jgi:hypothetical protein
MNERGSKRGKRRRKRRRRRRRQTTKCEINVRQIVGCFG